jgi:phage shock protein A
MPALFKTTATSAKARANNAVTEPAAAGISMRLQERIRDLEQSLREERRSLAEAEQRYQELEQKYRELLQQSSR